MNLKGAITIMQDLADRNYVDEDEAIYNRDLMEMYKLGKHNAYLRALIILEDLSKKEEI